MKKTDYLLILIALLGVCIIIVMLIYIYKIYATHDLFVSLSHSYIQT